MVPGLGVQGGGRGAIPLSGSAVARGAEEIVLGLPSLGVTFLRRNVLGRCRHQDKQDERGRGRLCSLQGKPPFETCVPFLGVASRRLTRRESGGWGAAGWSRAGSSWVHRRSRSTPQPVPAKGASGRGLPVRARDRRGPQRTAPPPPPAHGKRTPPIPYSH